MKGIHRAWFVLAIILIVIYGWLDPERYPFPQCPVRSLTGWLCPGCGSQRAIHQLLQGNIASSFLLNPLFIPAILYALAGALTSSLSPRTWSHIRPTYFGKWAAYMWLCIIILFSIGRNLF